MIKRTLLGIVVVGLLAGCGKKKEEAPASTGEKKQAVNVSDLLANPAPSAEAATTPAGDGAPPPPAADSAPAAANPAEVDPAIKEAIKKYVEKKHISPRSWIDLTVEQGYLQGIPMGKDGKPLDFEKTMAKLGIPVL